MPALRFRSEISPGLVVTVDEALCIVVESDRPRHTVTNVYRFKGALDDARAWVEAVRAETEQLRDDQPNREEMNDGHLQL